MLAVWAGRATLIVLLAFRELDAPAESVWSVDLHHRSNTVWGGCCGKTCAFLGSPQYPLAPTACCCRRAIGRGRVHGCGRTALVVLGLVACRPWPYASQPQVWVGGCPPTHSIRLAIFVSPCILPPVRRASTFSIQERDAGPVPAALSGFPRSAVRLRNDSTMVGPAPAPRSILNQRRTHY